MQKIKHAGTQVGRQSDILQGILNLLFWTPSSLTALTLHSRPGASTLNCAKCARLSLKMIRRGGTA